MRLRFASVNGLIQDGFWQTVIRACVLWLCSIIAIILTLEKAKAQQFRNEDQALFSARDLAEFATFPRVATIEQRAALGAWAQKISAILALDPGDRPGERALQQVFFDRVFVSALGYGREGGETFASGSFGSSASIGSNGASGLGWTLESEFRTDVDLTRPDGVLGFFAAEPAKKDVRVVIELKRPGADLDERQDRSRDRRTPVDQAFSYAHKFDAVDWVIVSNFSELRLYHARSSKYALHFDLSTMAEASPERRVFFQLLHRLNLIETPIDAAGENQPSRTLELFESRNRPLAEHASLD